MTKNLVPRDADARYEFRTFGQDFAEATYRMARLSEPVPERFWNRHSQETYVIPDDDTVHNIKLRDDVLDIKLLISTAGVLEQWSPIVKVGFPVLRDVLTKDVLSKFQCDFPLREGAIITESQFLKIVKRIPGLHIASVRKERHGYQVNGSICEVANVFVNGARLTTISVESTDVDAITKTIADIGLSDFENINYVQAIRRVIGVNGRPLPN